MWKPANVPAHWIQKAKREENLLVIKNIRSEFYKTVSDLGITKEGDKAVHFKNQDMSNAPKEPGLKSKAKRTKKAEDKA